MKTTAIVVEILIVGIQTLVWLIAVASSLFKYPFWDKLGPTVDEWSIMTLVMFLVAAYTIGLIVDRLVDTIFNFFTRRSNGDWRLLAAKWGSVGAKRDTPDNRMLVLAAENKASDYCEYLRRYVRMMRATAFNSVPTAVAIVWFLRVHVESIKLEALHEVLILGLGFLMFGLTLHILMILEHTYDQRIDEAFEAHKKKPLELES